ncbi:flavin-containing monooxygenase [Talaromyces proteolyticus]|uniref:Flavin-containing monooxygenase n=1 Tax=Talaromyces proteolyticus TaxID=1131652 RepID=A0AAD4KKJ6_9EURO|nr:flavin-containing monooxygenase [Talaromyces proteolyticus]KAH8693807.1 flavin-containing monooxygenase [Talaromyces proteolyticus]
MRPPTENQHTIKLPTTPKVALETVKAREVVHEWITALSKQLKNGQASELSELFHEDSWWRDMLGLDWEFHTIQGLQHIQEFVSQNQPRVQLSNLRLPDEGKSQAIVESPVEGLTWISSMFFFDTSIGSGCGVIYLTQEVENGKWKAYSVYTSLQELRGREETLGLKRPEGTIESMPGGHSRGNWIERRQKQIEFEEEEPTVLIVGAGQSGLNLGARLQALNLSCLVVDKNERVGDNWRKRYRTLITHDHAETCHMSYLPFPKNWPKYSSKDKLADWFEAYASIMELNVWLKTEIKVADYDETKKRWSVILVRDGVERQVHPRHIAWCAGHLGLPKIPNFPGEEKFKGTIYHGSQHYDAGQHSPKGKKVIIVGTGNSGHDIAQDFYTHGAHVTMLQRGGTYVLTEQKGLPLLPENMNIENNQTCIEDADVMSESLPWPVTLALCVDLTRRITAADKETLDGLEKAGFKLEFGHDGAGILRLIVARGGGYYIDFGTSQLIIDGKIKVKNCPEGIAGFDEHNILLNDGSHLEADVVVLATGYDNMRESVRKVLGDHLADQCKDVWGLDEEGEIKTIWRPSGHPGFWFMGGSLSLCRIYSKFVALQIAATEIGLRS